MPIKSFRGKMTNDTMDTINLHTNNGSVGYRIKKFQVMQATDADVEATIKIYSVEQTANTNDIDFSDNTLLAAAYFTSSSSGQVYPEDQTVVFDNMVFNQDIYITLRGHNYAADVNYYLELEQVKLDLNENTVATLKDIRNIVEPTVTFL
tara:strand:- start:83 stop:532 length:450 start_codon:yes stop_codon:yes gene_type:complete